MQTASSSHSPGLQTQYTSLLSHLSLQSAPGPGQLTPQQDSLLLDLQGEGGFIFLSSHCLESGLQKAEAGQQNWSWRENGIVGSPAGMWTSNPLFLCLIMETSEMVSLGDSRMRQSLRSPHCRVLHLCLNLDEMLEGITLDLCPEGRKC